MSDMSSDWVGSERPIQQSGGSGGKRRGLWLGAAAVTVVLIGGGAALAVQVLSGGGAQPDSAVPGDVLGFARIDIDPSADQKVNAVRLLRRVPQFEEETGITSDRDDLRKKLYDTFAQEGEGCPDYEDGVEPWLGDREGFAAMPAGAGSEPDPLVVVQVTDEDAAKAGITELSQCSGSDGTGVAFVGDYALIAETQDLADDFAAAAEEAPLADDADYLADMDALGEAGIASGWLDLQAAFDQALTGDEQVAFAASGAGQAESAAMALTAGSDNLELTLAVNGTLMSPDAGVTSFGDLPASTLFGFGFTGGAEAVQKLWDQAQSSSADSDMGDLEDFAATVERETGFVLPRDVQTLFGDDFVLALDSEGLELDSSGIPDPRSIRLGLRTSSEFAEVQELAARFEQVLAFVAPADLVEQESERGSVIASNDDYAAALAEGGGLADAANYQAAVADADEAAGVMYVDFDLMLDVANQLSDQTGAEMPADARETLEVLSAFGVSSSVDGEYSMATMRLVFD